LLLGAATNETDLLSFYMQQGVGVAPKANQFAFCNAGLKAETRAESRAREKKPSIEERKSVSFAAEKKNRRGVCLLWAWATSRKCGSPFCQ
jgi:hypothetical protein